MEPTTIGIIGCGNISDAYLRGAARSQLVRVKSVADIRAEAAKAKATRVLGCGCPVDTLLADPDIEIVVNLTVPAAHAPVSLQIIEAGKHVYLEKPLATRLHRCEAGDAGGRRKRTARRLCARHVPGRRPSGLPLRNRCRPDRSSGRGCRDRAVAWHGALASEPRVLLSAWRRADPRPRPLLCDATRQPAGPGLARHRAGLDRRQDAHHHQRAACRSDDRRGGADHGEWRAVLRQRRQRLAQPFLGRLEAQAPAARDLRQRGQHAGARSELLRRRTADHPARWRLDAARHQSRIPTARQTAPREPVHTSPTTASSDCSIWPPPFAAGGRIASAARLPCTCWKCSMRSNVHRSKAATSSSRRRAIGRRSCRTGSGEEVFA